MFVRKKKNRSGTISVVVVSKSHGQFKEVKSFGVAQTESDAENLYQTALHWLKTHGGQQTLDFENNKGLELEETMRVISNMDAVLINGTQLLLDRIYDLYYGRITQTSGRDGRKNKKSIRINRLLCNPFVK